MSVTVKAESLADIAPEILYNVFEILEPVDLTQCQLICSKWSRVAQEQLYKNIIGFSSSAKFERFMKTISSSPSKPGEYVKTINLNPLSEDEDQQGDNTNRVELLLTEKEVRMIGEYCPKVESFEARGNDQVYKSLLSQIKGGYFKHLEKIPAPSTESKNCLAYANVAVALAKNLKHLAIQFLQIKYNENGPSAALNRDINLQNNGLVSNLKSFAQLKQLCIIEINGLGRSLSRYDHIINQCSASLEELFVITSCGPEYFMTAYNAAKNISASATIINLIPNSTVKILAMEHGCLIEEESVSYMMQKFRSLEQVSLNIWGMRKRLSRYMMVELLRYISSIPKFLIMGYVRKGEETDITELVSTYIENAYVPTHINALLEFTQQDNERLEATEFHPAEEIIQKGFLFAASFVKLNSHGYPEAVDNPYCRIFEDDKDRVIDLHVQFVRHSDEISQARGTFVEGFLTKLGKKLKQLTISAYSTPSPNLLMLSGAPNLQNVKVLDTNVLKYCSNLRSLGLQWMNLQNRDTTTQNSTINNGLIKLQLEHSWINEEALSELVIRFPNLKELCIINCIFLNNTSNSTNNAAKIIMPDISLDALGLVWSGAYTGIWNNQYSKLLLKICTSSNTGKGHDGRRIQHFGLNESEMKAITEEVYEVEMKVDPVGCLSYEITCRYISAIIIHFNDLPRPISLDLDQ